MQEKRIDVWCKWENLINSKQEDFIEASSTCLSDRIFTGLFSEFPKAKNVDSLGFLSHSLNIVRGIIVGVLLTWLFLYLARLLNSSLNGAQDSFRIEAKRLGCLRAIGKFVIFANKKQQLTVLNLIMISFVLFLQNMFSFLTSNIKTNEVIVDTSGFIHTKEGLENTEKYGCWYEGGSTYNFIRLLGRDNWLRKVMDEKRMPDGALCLLDSVFEEITFEELANHSDRAFLIMNRLSATYALSILSKFNKNKVSFLNSFIDTELAQVIYSSKLLEAGIRRRLLSKIVTISEVGLLLQLYEQFLLESVAMITSGKFYTNVKSLTDDSAKVDNLSLDYFKSLLFYLFAVYLVTFLAFILHILLKLFKKRSRRFLKIAFNRYKIDLDVRIVLKCPTFRRR